MAVVVCKRSRMEEVSGVEWVIWLAGLGLEGFAGWMNA